MKVIAIIKYLFTLIGAAMLAGAFFWYGSTSNFLKEAVKAEGAVVELVRSQSSDSTTYRPVVHFLSQDGRQIEFTSTSGSNPPSYTSGEKVEVLYLPSAPQDARINGFFSLWGGPVIVGGMGSLFFLIGAGIMLAGLFKGRSDDKLRLHGTPVSTQFQSVEQNRSLSVNGRHPFRIFTQWHNPATSELHIFQSNNLWFDPSDHINQQQITVFIDAANPKKYLVDLSFLPKLAQ